MSTMTLVDTDILIDAARQIPEAVECLADIEQQSALAISAIAQMELLVGCRDKTELRHTERFLQRFQVLKLTEPVSDMAIDLLRQYRLSHGLAIAATALVWNQPFMSKNQRDYRFINGLQLLPYPQTSTSST